MELEKALKLLNALQSLSDDSEKPQTQTGSDTLSGFVGKYVLVRAHRMGVNVGTFCASDADFIQLTETRKLWRWKAKEGVALESVAKCGIKEGTRATATVDSVHIRKDDICGIITIDDAGVISQIKNWSISEQD